MESRQLKDFKEKIQQLGKLPSLMSIVEMDKRETLNFEAKYIVSCELPDVKPDEIFDEILDLFCSGKISRQQSMELLDEYYEITLKSIHL